MITGIKLNRYPNPFIYIIQISHRFISTFFFSLYLLFPYSSSSSFSFYICLTSNFYYSTFYSNLLHFILKRNSIHKSQALLARQIYTCKCCYCHSVQIRSSFHLETLLHQHSKRATTALLSFPRTFYKITNKVIYQISLTTSYLWSS